MKELELLTILTHVRGEYILQAQELRSGQRKQLRVMHRKRIFLIAAVISLLLLLVGCAAVLIGMQKVSLGRVTFPQYSQPGWTMDLVSTNGYLDFEDGGNPVVRNCIMAGCDPVLMDAYCCGLLHIPVEEVPYIGLRAQLGVGCGDAAQAKVCTIGWMAKRQSENGWNWLKTLIRGRCLSF